MKKLLSCLALVLILALVLPGCAVRNVPVVMEYQGLRLDEDVYEYWVACYRAQFAYDETEENRARLAEMTDLNIMKTFVAAALFDRYGLQLDTEKAEGKMIAAMVELLGDITKKLTNVEDTTIAISDELDEIEEDLDAIEDFIMEFEEDEDEEYDDDEDHEDDFDDEEYEEEVRRLREYYALP